MATQTAIDTSSISFTALYTGHTWVANGLSDPAFKTTAGGAYFYALTPVEWAGRLILGDNFRTVLLQRHRIMDSLLERAIEEREVTQVLEIACGLSPRGLRFKRRRPELHYLESDLPEMAQRKEQLLDTLEGPVPDVVPINILAKEGALSLGSVLQRFDRSQPIAVITEGLTVYFDRETISEFWTRLASQMAEFSHGTYLSDTYFRPTGPTRWILETARAALGAVARSQVSFHFGGPDELKNDFEALLFTDVTVHDPRHYYQRLPLPRSRRSPIVRVVEAQV